MYFTNLTGQEDVMLTLDNKSTEPGKGTKNSPNIELLFKHKLSKISFRFKAENATAVTKWGNISKIELVGYPNNITLDLTKGAGDYTVKKGEGNISDMVVFQSASLELKAYEIVPPIEETPDKNLPFAMVPPTAHGVATDDLRFRITSSTGTIKLTSITHSDYVLAPGTHYVYTITLKENKEVAFKVQIATWLIGGPKDIIVI